MTATSGDGGRNRNHDHNHNRSSDGSAHGDIPADPTELLAGAALTVFRLNGQFLDVAESLARPAGLTAAWWQVLGAVVGDPLPVAGIARAMGITRQSVQRIADLLVEQGLAEYRPNPAHARAKLLTPTEDGRAAMHRISPAQRAMAEKLATHLGVEEFQHILAALRTLTAALDAVTPD